MNAGWKNVLDNNGPSISLTGMSIVFIALLIISICISLMPSVLRLLAQYIPEKVELCASENDPSTDDANIVAAIGYVLHKMKSMDKHSK